MPSPSVRRAFRIAGRILKLLVCAVVFGAAAFCVADFFGAFETPLLSEDSPDGRWTLSVLYGEPFIFGPHPMRLFLRDNRWLPIARPVLSFLLANDGKRLYEGNCRVEWRLEDGRSVAYVACRGEEQELTTYRVDPPWSARPVP